MIGPVVRIKCWHCTITQTTHTVNVYIVNIYQDFYNICHIMVAKPDTTVLDSVSTFENTFNWNMSFS